MAAEAGLRSGDVILSLDGERTNSVTQWRGQLAVKGVGEEVTLRVLWDGETREVPVSVVAPQELVEEDDSVHPLLCGGAF